MRDVNYLFTLGAHQSGFVLALEKIHNDRVVSGLVDVPTVGRHFLIWTSVRVWDFCIWFLENAVQIFVKAVQQECKQLL